MQETSRAPQASDHDVAPLGLARAGEPWTREDIERLADCVCQGQDVEEIAASLGRTPGAVHARIRLLVPPEVAGEGGAAYRMGWLCHQLRQGTYDPVAVCAGTGTQLWSSEHDELLRAAWTAGTPTLAQLASRLEASEVLLVRRLIQLGVARTLVEVTDRLGCAPDGTVAFRRALALDRAQYTVHVLVVLEGDQVHQVSVHPDHDQAQAAGDQIVAALHERGATGAHFQIAACFPGQRGILSTIAQPHPGSAGGEVPAAVAPTTDPGGAHRPDHEDPPRASQALRRWQRRTD